MASALARESADVLIGCFEEHEDAREVGRSSKRKGAGSFWSQATCDPGIIVGRSSIVRSMISSASTSWPQVLIKGSAHATSAITYAISLNGASTSRSILDQVAHLGLGC